MSIQTFDNNIALGLFDNVTDYFNKANQEPLHNHNTSRDYGNRTWNGSDSWQETLERHSKGWKQGTEKAQDLITRITPMLRTVKGYARKRVAQPYGGGNFLVENYCKGLPEVCNHLSPMPSRKFVSIVVNNSASAGVDSEVLQRRGIAAVALVRALEQNNYRVSVKLAYAQKTNANGKYIFMFTVINLKNFDQFMEIDRLAFFLSDTSAFRRLYFSYMESQEHEIHKDMLDRSYGIPIELDKAFYSDKDIYFPMAHLHSSQWHSVEGTVSYIKTLLEKYGVVQA